LEILVVFSLIMIGIIGVASLMLQNIKAQNVNRNYLVSSMLAQEGLELVRNIRDNNWLDSSAEWHEYIYNAGGDNTYTVVATTTNAGLPDIRDFGPDAVTDAGARLRLDGFYNHSSGEYTPFYRLITVTAEPPASTDPDYLKVEAHVQWQEKGATHNYKASCQLTPWR